MTHTLGVHQHITKKPKKFKKFFDVAIYFVAIGGPLMIIPQSVKIFLTRDAQSIAIASFIGFFTVSIFWVIYGVIHNEKPIVYSNILYTVLHGSVILGAIIYG